MNTARQHILDRVRNALRVQARQPLAPTGSAIWPAMGDLEETFRAEFKALHGELIESPAELEKFLAGQSVCVQHGLDITLTGARPAPMETADIGVTGCDCLVARTGSIVVSTRAAGGRALSVWPPVHLVVAKHGQLVPDLAAAMSLLRQRYDKHWPSQISVITGPSRTSDIEKVLVLGAHGPKRLVLYFAPEKSAVSKSP